MASRTSRKRKARGEGMLGWIWTLATGALLIVVGFGVGLVLGVSSEEPELVVGHLAGRSQEVPWHVEDPASSLADDGAQGRSPGATEAPRAAGEPQAARVAVASESALPGVAASPPTSAAFAIQVGAFSSDDAAREVVTSLRAKGYTSYLTPSAGARDGRWRVRVGPYATRDEADRDATRLKRDEKLPTWVLSEAG